MTTIVRTAGMVNGTPDWQLDLMWEGESARIWEEQNAPDPYETQMKNAAIDMKCACGDTGISKAIYYLMDAQEELKGTPMEDKVGSLIEVLEDIECDIRSLAEKYGKGKRT